MQHWSTYSRDQFYNLQDALNESSVIKRNPMGSPNIVFNILVHQLRYLNLLQ